MLIPMVNPIMISMMMSLGMMNRVDTMYVGSLGNSDTHMVVYKVEKLVDLESFDYSFLILTTR
jgi:hypothetical protein